MYSNFVTTLLLCCYGFFKEFRPTEPYLYAYEHTTLNISEQVLNQEVYPIWTYSYLITLIPAFLLTDVLLYKSVIVFEAISYAITWSIIVFTSTVTGQKFVEVFYGWATASEVAYFAYIYVQVPKQSYKAVTANTRAALLAGRFSAYTVAQLIILLKWGTYQTLNIISLVGMGIAVFFSVVLPNVSWKTAYERKLESKGNDDIDEKMETAKYKDFIFLYFKSLYKDFTAIYSDPFLLKWSLWWALSTCIFTQIINYMQTLWGTLPNQNVFNGMTEALVPLFGIPADLITQRITLNWSKWGELVLSIGSLLQAGLLLTVSQTNQIVVMYVGYIIYRVIYQASMTVAQCNLATKLKSDSFGLLFGLNTFCAILLQSLLTITVVNIAKLSIRPQFVVYSIFHFAIAAIFLSTFFALLGYRFMRRSRSFSNGLIS